jgi:hypothetical protein
VLEYEGCTLLGAGMRPVLELFVWKECCESSVEALEPYADSTLPWSPNIVSNWSESTVVRKGATDRGILGCPSGPLGGP